jgi:hypothetical protein
MRSSFLISCLAAGVLAMHAGNASADDKSEVRRSSIEGAWEVVVTLRVPAADCTTAAPVAVGPNPFPSFNTFHRGGTMSEWSTRAPPATRGSGHGVWRRVSDDDFVYRLMFHSFDANGLLAAKMDIRSNLTLAADGQTFEGVSRFVFTDLSGFARNFCATLAGTRMLL